MSGNGLKISLKLTVYLKNTISGGHALRHLRDRLLSAEQWALALEVSTKAGLDRTGVWAAWGKACLKAGKWQEAREHLMHCLQPTVSSNQDSAPAPLLSEITRILEESAYAPDDTVVKQAERINSPALSVLHSLNSLTAISQGKLSVSDMSAKQPTFYAECQYYLKNYGSTASTVAFFLSHADLVSALRLTRDKLVEPEVFAEALYKPCLVLGLVGQLFKEMKKMDPSLEMWKVKYFSLQNKNASKFYSLNFIFFIHVDFKSFFTLISF